MARCSQEESDGWRKVGRRKGRNSGSGYWDVAGGGAGRLESVSTTFLTEFGEKWKARDLFFELKELGDLEEVVVSPRRDRRGRRFGFASFNNVKDEKMLAVKLDNMVLEGRKLYANLSRFQRPARVQ